MALMEDLQVVKAEAAPPRRDLDQLVSLVGKLIPTVPPGQ
jgi:hypothetical protein